MLTLHRQPCPAAAGALHRALTLKPNSAYLLDPAGTIRYRAH
ncbi:MAG TPA: hypothetical protein VFV73_34740 [Streptosporangiaceae bacterium]|nr:hypothetical protein [Streptosporangiaceae bacterium]